MQIKIFIAWFYYADCSINALTWKFDLLKVAINRKMWKLISLTTSAAIFPNIEMQTAKLVSRPEKALQIIHTLLNKTGSWNSHIPTGPKPARRFRWAAFTKQTPKAGTQIWHWIVFHVGQHKSKPPGQECGRSGFLGWFWVMEPPVSNSIWHIFATDSISLGFVMLAVTFIMLVGVPAPQPGELWSHHNSHSKPYPPRGWALQTFDFPSGVQWQICIINMRVISTDAT